MATHDLLQVLAGLVAGAAVAWYVASRRVQVMFQAEISDAKRRADKSVAVAKAQIAADMERREQEAATLKARLDEERHGAEATRSKLQADLVRLEQERTRLESRLTELTAKVEELNLELKTAADDGMRDLEELHDAAGALEQAFVTLSGTVERMESRLLAAAKRVKEFTGTKG